MATNPKIETYIRKHKKWQDCLEILRQTCLESGMEETVKWGIPVYTLDGKNLVGIGAFKSYFGLWFYQGVFLSDPDQVLINAQEGKTKAMRHWKFNDTGSIPIKKIKAYLIETIANHKAGKEIVADRTKPVMIPQELKELMEKDKTLANRFNQFSKACQREFANYIGEAKKPETRIRRLNKVIPMIEQKVVLNDRYRKN